MCLSAWNRLKTNACRVGTYSLHKASNAQFNSRQKEQQGTSFRFVDRKFVLAVVSYNYFVGNSNYFKHFGCTHFQWFSNSIKNISENATMQNSMVNFFTLFPPFISLSFSLSCISIQNRKWYVSVDNYSVCDF